MPEVSSAPRAGLGAVPVIDISSYFRGSEADKRALARRIDEACRTIGFLVISGHGVPTGLGERMHGISRAFYDLPDGAKRRYISPDQRNYRGYFALGGLAAAYSLDDRRAAPDYREMYVVGRVGIDPHDGYYTGERAGRIFPPNIWPDDVVAGFSSVWSDYYREMERLARAMMHLCALALDLPETWFDDKIDKHMSTMAVTNYPDQDKEPLPGQLRAGAHTDYGALTLLKSENKPGSLEVLNKAGEWEQVPMLPDTYVVNIGDLMARWTNDRWVSTMHRVGNPPRDKAKDSRRQSLIYFFHPNYNASIECIPSCRKDVAPKYPPITTGEHLMSKIQKMQEVKPS